MANTLSKTGIVDNSTIRVWHVTQSIDAFTGTSAYDITLSGSLTITGSLNLDSPVTGNLITSASYATTSSYALTSLSASNSSYANISYDTLTIQLHHGQIPNPLPNTSYFFSINPLEHIALDKDQTGIYSPTSITRIINASFSTTVNGTLGTLESSDYILWVGGNSKSFTNTLQHDSVFDSFVEAVNLAASTTDKIYVEWKTPSSWSTPPTQISHNVVLYCTRNFNPA